MSLPIIGATASQAPADAIYVGLDLSLASTGIAVVHGHNITVSRVRTKPVGQSSEEQSARLDLILDGIMAAVPVSDQTRAAVEGPAFGSNDKGAHVRGGLWWLVRRELRHAGIDVIVCPPASVKKYATGKGNAQKDAVLAAVIRRYPDVDVTGNDEADALTLAAMRARIDGAPFDSVTQACEGALNGVGR